jgi:hypothetical protein
MSETNLPKWFLVVAVLAVIWNAMGVMAYVQQVTMGPETLAELPAEERAMYENIPSWAMAAYAIAVFAGLFGSVLLVMRRSMASPLFMASLAGVLVQMTYSFFLSDAMEVLPASAMVMSILIIVIAIALVCHSRRSAAQGWLR